MTYLKTIDWIEILLYFALIAGIAWWATKKKKNSAEDYFLAGRHLGWFLIGASIFASNIGSEHLVGLAGSGATDGVALAHYELHAWCLLVLGWVMVPFYMRSKVFTMPEFLERRFSPQARTVLSVISLIAYILTKIAVGIYAGGIVFRVLLPEVHFLGMDSFWIGSILLIILNRYIYNYWRIKSRCLYRNASNIYKNHRRFDGNIFWIESTGRMGQAAGNMRK